VNKFELLFAPQGAVSNWSMKIFLLAYCLDCFYASGLDERIAHECLGYLEANLDKGAGKAAMEKFYTNNNGVCLDT